MSDVWQVPRGWGVGVSTHGIWSERC